MRMTILLKMLIVYGLKVMNWRIGILFASHAKKGRRMRRMIIVIRDYNLNFGIYEYNNQKTAVPGSIISIYANNGILGWIS